MGLDKKHRLERRGSTIHASLYPTHNMDLKRHTNSVHQPLTETSPGELYMLHMVRCCPGSLKSLRKMEIPASVTQNTAMVGCRLPRRCTKVK